MLLLLFLKAISVLFYMLKEKNNFIFADNKN